VAFIHQGKDLVSASRDGSLRVWNIDLADALKTLPNRYDCVTCLAVSPDGRWLAVGNGNWKSVDGGGHVVIWDLQTLQEEADFECDLAVGALEFKSDNNTLAAGDFRGRVTFWDLAGRQRIGTTAPKYKDAVAEVRFSADTQALAHVGLDDIIASPDSGPASPMSLRFDFSRSVELKQYLNHVAAETSFESILLEPAAATGLRDLQNRIDALEQSVEWGDSGTAVRQQPKSPGEPVPVLRTAVPGDPTLVEPPAATR
jgi:hypothetical protein